MRISLRGIVKRFGDFQALAGLDLDVYDGEFFTLLGPSGCGKTTTLRLIAGFYQPDAGQVLFDGKVVNSVPTAERNIGIVFQNFALWPHMTVRQNITYGLKLRKVRPSDTHRRADEILKKIGLGDMGSRRPAELSGGQQQRVALARALVLNPDVLLLDEPLSNLDAKVRTRLRAEIRKLQQSLKITTIYVTHDQEEALTLSDRIAVMNQGRVLQMGTPKELYETPKNVFTADFIGTNNILRGRLLEQSSSEGRCLVDTDLGRLQGTSYLRFRSGDKCAIAIRPENLTLRSPESGQASVDACANVLTGTIGFSYYMGNVIRYDVEVDGRHVIKVDIRDPWHHAIIPVGARVTLEASASVCLVIPDAFEDETCSQSGDGVSGDGVSGDRAVVGRGVNPA
ncbi:MAG: ABC transporter ATP-binding protein [Clostridia bacterium]